MYQMHRVIARTIASLALGTAASATWPAVSAAQSPETPPQPGFEITGFTGVLTPLARLADQGDTVTVELSTKVAFGAEVEYWLPGGIGVSLLGAYSGPDLAAQTIPSEGGFPVSRDIGTTDYWIGTANVLYRPKLGGSAAVLLPYFGVGAGLLSVDYPDSGDLLLEDETRFTGVLIAGAHIAFSRRMHFRLDLRDFVSSFSTEPFDGSKLQNDIVTSVGLGIRVP